MKSIMACVIREMELDLDILIDAYRDDDGCGDPVVTGNQMTGARGSLRAQQVELNMTDAEIAAQVRKKFSRYVHPDDDDVEDAVAGE